MVAREREEKKMAQKIERAYLLIRCTSNVQVVIAVIIVIPDAALVIEGHIQRYSSGWDRDGRCPHAIALFDHGDIGDAVPVATAPMHHEAVPPVAIAPMHRDA